MSIIIDEEFKNLIPPLSEDEFRQLEENCVKDGIRDPLVVWPQGDGNDILVDGHNRFRISAMHSGIRFDIKRMEFRDRYEAKLWIINNQLGKRNLIKYDKVRLEDQKRQILAEQAREKKLSFLKQNTSTEDKKSCPRRVQTRQEKRENSTDYKIAKAAGTSEDTVRKVRAINEKGSPALIEAVRKGDKTINQAHNEIREQERIQADLSARAHLEKAEKRHEEFKNRQVVSFDDTKQDIADVSEIANNRISTIRNAVKKVLFFGVALKSGDIDLSAINQRTVSRHNINGLLNDIDLAIDILSTIRNQIGGINGKNI